MSQKQIDNKAWKRKAYQSQRGLMADENTKHVFERQIRTLQERFDSLGVKLDACDPTLAHLVAGYQAARKEIKDFMQQFDVVWLNMQIKTLDEEIKTLQLRLEKEAVAKNNPSQRQDSVAPPR